MPYIEGIATSEEELHSCHVSTVHVQSEQAAETLQKPIGSYITIETGKPLSRHDHIMSVGECLAEVLGRVLRPHYHGKLFKPLYETCFNITVWRKAVSQFEVGMTLDECINIFLQTELTHNVPREPSSIGRLVQGIAPPMYERVPGNDDESTFDYIRITVGFPRYQFNSWEALQNEVKKYQPEIYQRVAQRIETDCQFKKGKSSCTIQTQFAD